MENMEDKKFITIGEVIISFKTIQNIEKDKENRIVTLYAHILKPNGTEKLDSFVFKDENAEKVWDIFDRMSIHLPTA
jgi:hypothetical protein